MQFSTRLLFFGCLKFSVDSGETESERTGRSSPHCQQERGTGPTGAVVRVGVSPVMGKRAAVLKGMAGGGGGGNGWRRAWDGHRPLTASGGLPAAEGRSLWR